MNSPELLLLVENCPKGAETLVTRCLHSLTDKGAPHPRMPACHPSPVHRPSALPLPSTWVFKLLGLQRGGPLLGLPVLRPQFPNYSGVWLGSPLK